jgi:hypothetical protein
MRVRRRLFPIILLISQRARPGGFKLRVQWVDEGAGTHRRCTGVGSRLFEPILTSATSQENTHPWGRFVGVVMYSSPGRVIILPPCACLSGWHPHREMGSGRQTADDREGVGEKVAFITGNCQVIAYIGDAVVSVARSHQLPQIG